MPYSSECRFVLFAFAFIGSTIISQAGMAAEIFFTPEEVYEDVPMTEINIVGEIEAGDTSRLQSLLQTADPRIEINIWSPGGDLYEAMKLGRLVRDRFLIVNAPTVTRCETRADPQLGGSSSEWAHDLWWGSDQPMSTRCACYSACFVIWAAGVIRDGGENATAMFTDKGDMTFVGVHRPKLDDAYFAGLGGKEAEEKYSKLIAAYNRYLVEMDIPPSFVEEMVTVPSNEIRMLTPKELSSLSGKIPAVDEWIRSKCGALSGQESDDYWGLWTKWLEFKEGAGPPLSNAEQFYYDVLRKSRGEISDCEWDAIEAEQESRRN